MPTSVFHTNDGVGGGGGGDGVAAQRPSWELIHRLPVVGSVSLTQHAPLLLKAQSLEQPAPSQKTPVLLTLHAACRRRASPASGTLRSQFVVSLVEV